MFYVKYTVNFVLLCRIKYVWGKGDFAVLIFADVWLLKDQYIHAAFCRIFVSIKLVLILIMLTSYTWKFSYIFLHAHLNT